MADFWDERDVQRLPPIHLTYSYLDSDTGRLRVDAVDRFAARVKKEPGIAPKDVNDFALMQPLAVLDAIENGWAEVGPEEENPTLADWTGYLDRVYHKLTEAQKLLHYHHCDAMDEWDIGHGRFADGGPFCFDTTSYWLQDEPPLRFLFGPWTERVKRSWPEYSKLTASFVERAEKDPEITSADLNDFLFMCSYTFDRILVEKFR